MITTELEAGQEFNGPDLGVWIQKEPWMLLVCRQPHEAGLPTYLVKWLRLTWHHFIDCEGPSTQSRVKTARVTPKGPLCPLRYPDTPQWKESLIQIPGDLSRDQVVSCRSLHA